MGVYGNGVEVKEREGKGKDVEEGGEGKQREGEKEYGNGIERKEREGTGEDVQERGEGEQEGRKGYGDSIRRKEKEEKEGRCISGGMG